MPEKDRTMTIAARAIAHAANASMRMAFLTLGGLRLVWRRLARFLAGRYDMWLLGQADERMLGDLGLTRGDVQAITRCGNMARAAAARRNEAMMAARRRKGRTMSGAARLHSMDNQMVGLHGTGTSR